MQFLLSGFFCTFGSVPFGPLDILRQFMSPELIIENRFCYIYENLSALIASSKVTDIKAMPYGLLKIFISKAYAVGFVS